MSEVAANARAGRSDLEWLTESLVESGGNAIEAILLYGSQLSKSSPSKYSAWDFVVIVRDYAPFHESLVESGHHIRKASTLTRIAGVLPPSVIAFSPTPSGLPIAKCLVVDRSDFERAMGPDSPDHFLKGRLVQRFRTEWVASDEVESGIEATLDAARHRVFDWAGPWLTQPMDAESLTVEMLQVSYRGEVRPESSDRVLEVADSQREWLDETYRQVLEDEVESGRLRRVEGGYAFVDPPGPSDRRRLARYFRRSKIRSTIRWGKHVLTFNDWLTYIQRKAERRTGQKIELTAAERRWPLILLWPKVFRVLRTKDDHIDAEPSQRELSE